MVKSRFYLKVSENLDSSNLDLFLSELAYEEAMQGFKDKDLGERVEEASKIFVSFCDDLNTLNLLNKQSSKSILQGIKKAITKEKEEYLYKLLYESEKISKQLEEQGRDIKNAIETSFKSIENSIKNEDIAHKGEILSAINDILINEVELRDIIKEISEAVFLSIIESGSDIKETAREFSKNMVYKSILESGFRKHRAIEIAKIVITEAINVANLSRIYVDELLSGAINGANEGIVKAMEKFKLKFKFAPDELNNTTNQAQKELLGVGEEFTIVLKNIANSSENPAKESLEAILKKDYDSYLAKMKRISSEASEQIKARLEQIDINENYKEISKFVATKFEDIKKDISAKSSKIIDEFDLEDKFSNFKKDIEEIEKKIASKFTEFKNRKTDSKTKELADRTYEATKDIIKQNKEKNADE